MGREEQGPVRAVTRERGRCDGARERARRLRQWLRERLSASRLGRLDPRLVELGVVCLLVAVSLTPRPLGWHTLLEALGIAGLCGALLTALHLAWLSRMDLRYGQGGLKDLVFLGALLVLSAVVARALLVFASALVPGWGPAGAESLAYGLPLSAGPLLAALFLGPQAGMLLALAAGLLAAMVWPGSLGLFAFYLIGGVVAAHQVEQGRTRASLLRAGAVGGLAGVVVLVAVSLAGDWFWSLRLPVALAAACLGGLVAGVLAAGLAPLMELAFGYTTDFSLMELASLDHPLLRELMLRAPGTYHHSLVVSSLVEAAAREIGANHLLARVAALYHDIGKVKKADYFVENQQGGTNRHEKLAASMSALILTSHVKEGVELARGHRLSRPLIDIMAQHHGTRIIHFFFYKAIESRRAAGQPDPDPEAFRYPGPRPQTREAGLVMLADTVEAASRSMDNPGPARIKGLVQTQINKVFAEGELDECELTLKDLHKIAKSFNTILNGIFHQRVEYPGTEDQAKKRNGDSDRQQAAGAGAQRGAPGPPDAPDLKRLGMRR